MSYLSISSKLKSAIRNCVAAKIGSPNIAAALQRLSRNGFHPRHIFDVGAYQGDFTKLCLNVWPAAKVTAFEVLEHKVHELRRLQASGVPLEVFPCLLGAESRASVPFHEMETASSVLTEHVNAGRPSNSYPMRTIDEITMNHGVTPPDFLKLDVQGYELEVLKGSERTLDAVGVILAELNLLDIHRGVPLLSEVVEWLDERRWVTYDICGMTRRPLDAALWQADFIFVPRNSALRTDKRWSEGRVLLQ